MKLHLYILTACLILLSGCGAGDGPSIDPIIEEPKTLTGISQIYQSEGNVSNNIETLVITSKEHYDSYISQLNDQDYLQQLEDASVDFSTENLLIYRLTKTSGALINSVSEPELVDEKITINIDLEIHETTVISSFILAYKLDKDITEIVFDDGTVQETLDIYADNPDLPSPPSLDDLSKINIPYQESGYLNLETLIVATQEEYDAYLNQITVQTRWDDKDSFIQALESEIVDFSIDNLLIYQITGPTDSNILDSYPEIIDGKVTIVISNEVEVLVTGTPSYVFAYTISKSLNEIVVNYDKAQNNLDIETLAEETKVLTNISQVGALTTIGYLEEEGQTLITSEEELNTFVGFISDQNSFGSNDELLQRLDSLDTDYSQKNVLVNIFGVSSGSIRVTAMPPKIIDDKVTVVFKYESPLIGTDDYVTYAIVYEIDKDINELVLGQEHILLDNNGNINTVE